MVLQAMMGCASHHRPQSFFFLQMADTQFGFFNENREFSKETVNFEKAITEANRLRPEFVVVCGDLVNKPGDTAQVSEYKRISATLNRSIKLYNVAGNHDVGNIPTAATLSQYRRDLGQDYYTFRVGRLFGIVLNSSLMKDPDSARAESAKQDEWLRSTLAQARADEGNLIVIFQHHSFFLRDPDEPDDYFNFPREKRIKYLELFKKYNVKYIFAGHYHRNAYGRAGDLEMVTTGPVGRPLGDDPSGFRVVVMRGDGLEHRYYSLDSIPKTINLK